MATRSASPSSAEPAGASAPSSIRAQAYLRSSAAAQLRDPDRYQIINEHGRGGLGRVSRAHDLDLGRDVAIKELISRGNLSEVRFLREALITARLEHPGIVPVHEAGRWPDGTPFYAMKLVAGRPLRDLIAERTSVPERIGLLHHVIAVADAIAYAHGRSIIHRDLKPANVIVGDFGETIVIDWGLAKDLSTADDATLGGGPFRATHDTDLTSAGSVLGTPAYMAPEQERGEHVDQRADVFAIGAMLWELCSLQKVPPTDPRLRHRLLRRAGIDQDLVTIIDKALAPDRQHRYADAGALASDLKAFKSGARIAARSYSFIASLRLWGRRHRALAATVATAITLLAAGTLTYIKATTAERDRADRALERLRQSSSDLLLAHAELLLHSDPSAASSLVASYQGDDNMRRAEILAEARGRGVAHWVGRPHTDTIWCMRGLADGSFISVGEDHRVQQTKDGKVHTLASNVSSTVRCAYNATSEILAYSTSPNGVALLYLSDFTTKSIQVSDVSKLSITSDGSLLAILTKQGIVSIWRLSGTVAMLHQELVTGAISMVFTESSALAITSSEHLHILEPESHRHSIVKFKAASIDTLAGC